jgi:probable rRNA maturation factor
MKEKIISEINLDLVFQCNDFSQFSKKFKDAKTNLIFESIFWEKVFLSWINTILKKEDYELPNYIFVFIFH